MGWGKSFTKPFKSAAKSVGHAVEKTIKGDISGAAKSLGNAAVSYTKGMTGMGIVEDMMMPKYPTVGAEADTAIDTLSAEAEETKKRRRALYSTSGGANGEEVEAVGVFANGRGSIFGN